ncbi:MAG TPA: HNH endonuclease signature motif containing protein, partial [Silvibacterium sp.]|nr:HNH endonuclease signature motif containing protein [Silvibacterium sp.]
GYRELRSNGEMRKLMNRKIALQHGKCAICEEKFTDYADVVPDHFHPRGLGGAWRDDHPDNIQAVHWWCNGAKGSSRLWPEDQMPAGGGLVALSRRTPKIEFSRVLMQGSILRRAPILAE